MNGPPAIAAAKASIAITCSREPIRFCFSSIRSSSQLSRQFRKLAGYIVSSRALDSSKRFILLDVGRFGSGRDCRSFFRSSGALIARFDG
jgi:hypothetical protein